MYTARLGKHSPRTSSSCSNIGRPVKGFEKWRTEARESNPISFWRFLKMSFEDIESKGGTVTLGFVQNGVWQDYYRGGPGWNYVKADFPGKESLYRKGDEFLKDWKRYVRRFQRWQQRL